MDDVTCPCGSDKPAAECCIPVIEGARTAETAEELMRSRYTAFTRGDIDWIMSSHHPATVEEVDREEVEQWATQSDWLGLKIRKTEAGEAGDGQGIVEFRARYRVNGQTIDHNERAEFLRDGGEWKFHQVVEELDEGAQLVPVAPKSDVGRNDPCPCGSGKKYKKCHGAAA